MGFLFAEAGHCSFEGQNDLAVCRKFVRTSETWGADSVNTLHMNTLLWLECGACSGESMAILGLDGPSERGQHNLVTFLEKERVRLLWHPSLSLESPRELSNIVDSILCGREELTLLCVEGSIIHGPNGTGMFDSFYGKPKKDLIAALCSKAEYVLAMGTCAAFGGIPAAPPNPTEASGIQFTLDKPGGLVSPEWLSKSGFPVINLSGCPVDAVTMLTTMSSILNGVPPALDMQNRPSTVRPCLSEGSCRKCGTAEKVGYSCYNCIGARFPINKRLFRHSESGKIKSVAAADHARTCVPV